MTDGPRRRFRWGWLLRRGLIALLATYLVVVVAACTFQRSLLYFPDPALRAPPTDGPPIRVVRLRTADGQSLVAWWLPSQPGQPTMLYFGGNGDSLIDETSRFTACAEYGVGMFSAAYEGYSGSSGHPSETALYRDGDAAWAWLAARTPGRDIVIQGYSLGTGVAVREAATHPARALILEAPYTSTVDVGEQTMWFLPVRLLMWDRFPSRDRIGQVHAPLLVIHGDADQTIPTHFGRELFALANPPKQLVLIPGGTHTNLEDLGAYAHIWSFLGVSGPRRSA